MPRTIISANSHIAEPPTMYFEHIERQRLPSEYFRDHICVTFQDDWVAFRTLDLMNPARLMWANDFPHSDSTWPCSQAVLQEHAAHLTEAQKDMILHDNVAGLYGLGL